MSEQINYILDIFSNSSQTDIILTVVVSCVILIFTLKFMSRNKQADKLDKRLHEIQDPVEEDTSTSPSQKAVTDFLLDPKDIEMIQKVTKLDTTNPGDLKKYVQEVRTQSYKSSMTDVEKEREESAKQEQLAQIFALMNHEKDTFGDTSITELKEQMALYG